MNRNAKRWLRALRSGKYKQGTGCLRKRRKGEDFYCCLGVACDLAVKTHVIGRPRFDRNSREYVYREVKTGSLPNKVREWLGLADDEGFFEGGSSLAKKNDSGWSFKKIARLIESKPKGLFEEKP
jgi:hypothetical protein